MRGVENFGILKLVDAGVVQWRDGLAAYAFIYQKPTAPRMFASLDDVCPVLSEDSVNRTFIAPMIGAMMSLDNIGIVHHGIRPTNIFWRIGSTVPPQLGDGLSVPPGVGQPSIFEPIERAQAMPMGRGAGTHADDCYSFGITLAYLMIGGSPLPGMDERAILDLKMQRGSFIAIVGNRHLLPAQIEILRGLLSDNPSQRWTASDLDQWLGGRRMTLKSAEAGMKAARHFVFQGKEYWNVRELAEGLATNPPEAVKVIENESLNKWLRRALNNPERAKDVEEVIDEIKEGGKTAHYEDQLVARVCIALDPKAPLRYRGISAMPTGIATLVADSARSGNAQILAEIIASPLVSLWTQMQGGDNRTAFIAISQLFDRARSVLEKTTFGNGFERAIYEMNPGLPCQSPMLKGFYITAPKALLPALERIAMAGNRPREPIDRHIAAFLIVRERRSEKSFAAFAAPGENNSARDLALLALFADLQSKYGPESLPHLTSWLSYVVDPAIQQYANRTTRETLHKKAQGYITAGKLPELLRLIDSPAKLQRDRQDYSAAKLLYLNIQKEILSLESKNNNQANVAATVGRPIAVTVSSLLAVILICAALLRAMFAVLLR
jgi:hypothetical protein